MSVLSKISVRSSIHCRSIHLTSTLFRLPCDPRISVHKSFCKIRSLLQMLTKSKHNAILLQKIGAACPQLADLLLPASGSVAVKRVELDHMNQSEEGAERELEHVQARSIMPKFVSLQKVDVDSDSPVQNIDRSGNVEKATGVNIDDRNEQATSNRLLFTTALSAYSQCRQSSHSSFNNSSKFRELEEILSPYRPSSAIRDAISKGIEGRSYDEIFEDFPYNKLASDPGPDIFKIEVRPVIRNSQLPNDIEELDDVWAHLDTYNDRNLISKSLADLLRWLCMGVHDGCPTTTLLWGDKTLPCLGNFTATFFALGPGGRRRPVKLQMQVVPDKEMPLPGLILSKREIIDYLLLEFVQY